MMSLRKAFSVPDLDLEPVLIKAKEAADKTIKISKRLDDVLCVNCHPDNKKLAKASRRLKLVRAN